jgi:RNA polymerase sigma factor (sigma-70 family)
VINDTDIGGSRDRFPLTHKSVIARIGSDDEAVRGQAFESIIAAYWKPVYKYIRMKWNKSNEDAKDLAQAFFTRVIEKGFFNGYDPSRSRFRTYLRVCLDGFIANEEKAAQRIKRGGGVSFLSLDFENAEEELGKSQMAVTESLDDYFEKEWIRSLFGSALDSLRNHCAATGKEVHYLLFERYYLNESADAGNMTYDEIGRQFGLTATQVTNYLASARREFKRIVLEQLSNLATSDEEFRREARTLLGVEP